MRIAFLAPPYLPVPPRGYGGTELIVYHLVQGLVKKGHEVTLFASGDSKTDAKLFSVFPRAIGNSGEIKMKPLLPFLQYVECFKRAGSFDIIHNHAQYYAMFFAEIVNTPVVHTIHGSFAEGEVPSEKRDVLERFKLHNFVSISQDQRAQMPGLNWVGTVYNGIDMAKYPFDSVGGDYLLWIGRITQKKGTREAIEVARKTGRKLVIAGVVDPIDMEYFDKEVKPCIDGKQIKLIGEIDSDKAKAEIYGKAYAVLYPISWHEPFGLVMAESQACGTPVVAFRSGSVSEVVEDGKTGFVVDNTEEMVTAVGKLSDIKREDCRQRVMDNFTVEKMVEGYEAVYRKITGMT